MGESLLKYFYQIHAQILGLWRQYPNPCIWNHYSSISTKFMLQYLGCGHSTQTPVWIITQVFLPNPCSDIGLWPQYSNPCIWNHYASISTKSLLWYWAMVTVPSYLYMGKHYSGIPTKSLLRYWAMVTVPSYLYTGKHCSRIPTKYLIRLNYGHNTQIPVYGRIIFNYPYQIPYLILRCGHSTQIPVYGEHYSSIPTK